MVLRMLHAPDPIGIGHDLLLPVVVLRVQQIGVEAELSAPGGDDRLVVHMEGDPVAVGELLRQGLLPIPLDLF